MILSRDILQDVFCKIYSIWVKFRGNRSLLCDSYVPPIVKRKPRRTFFWPSLLYKCSVFRIDLSKNASVVEMCMLRWMCDDCR